MTDPLALLPLAAAAHGGRVDDFEARQLVAAGLTLLRRSAPLVRALSGRRSAILLPTGPAFLTALAASEGRGAVLVNPLCAPPEIAYQLADSDVGAVFTDERLTPRLPADVPRVLLDRAPATARWVGGGEERMVDLGSHVGDVLEGAPDAEGRDEEAVIVYTSAMAGVPLGAILTHRNLLSNARATIEAAGGDDGDVTLAVLPFAHLFGLTVTLIAPLLGGGRVRTVAHFRAARVISMLEEERITRIIGVPSVFAGLLAVLAERGAPLRAPFLHTCVCGGAPMPAGLQDRWADATGVELRQGYGLTEGGPVCLYNHRLLPNVRGTLGVPFPGVEVSIRDGSGAECAAGTEGEICVAGENVFAGYVRGGDAGLVRDGRWLRTGDLGVADASGRVTFRGVKKAMFTRNGFNIYPREIERAVRELDGVRDVRCRAQPDPLRENEIVIEVRGRPSEHEVRAWCEQRLASYKRPGVVYTLPA